MGLKFRNYEKIIEYSVFTINIGSSVNAEVMIKRDKSACEMHAEWMGTINEQNGGNYWEGYFAGYAECIGTIFE